MDHFINYTPHSEMSMVDLTVSDPKRAHIHFVIMYDHLTLNSQIPCEEVEVLRTTFFVYHHGICLRAPFLFLSTFSKIATGAFCLLRGHCGMNEWRDLLQGDLYSWGFFLPMCISAPEIWHQYCNISRVFSIAVTDLVDEGWESWSSANLRNQVGS